MEKSKDLSDFEGLNCDARCQYLPKMVKEGQEVKTGSRVPKCHVTQMKWRERDTSADQHGTKGLY